MCKKGRDGFARLRPGHGGGSSPPDCCQELPFESGNCNGNTKKTNPTGLVFHGGGGRIRFTAAKPRRLQQSTGLLLRAAFRIRLQNKRADIKRCQLFCGGGGRIRFAAAKPRRLQQSTGLLPRAAFRIWQLQRKYKKDQSNWIGLSWWGRTDSNHRSETQQIYSLSPLATRELPHIHLARLEPVDGLGTLR